MLLHDKYCQVVISFRKEISSRVNQLSVLSICRNATGYATCTSKAVYRSVQSCRPNLKTFSVCFFFFKADNNSIPLILQSSSNPCGTERHLGLDILKLRHVICLILNGGVEVSNSRETRTRTQSKEGLASLESNISFLEHQRARERE